MANGYNHSTPLGGDEEGPRLLDENHHAIGYGAAAEQPSMNANTMQHQSQPFGMSDMSATQAMTKSYSVHGEGSLSYLTPLQLGRHELYEMIPFTAVFGMQKKEKNMSKAFASYAADLETIEADQKIFAQTHHHLTLAELDSRRSQASLQLLDELEIDSVLITTPLIIAILVAGLSQFLVGYNTSVMNGCNNYVFPGHYSTLQWSIAVAAFAIGGPLGAILAGKIVDARGRRGALMINSYTFLVGGLVQTFASNMAYLTVGRLIIGCASGFSTVLVPIYLGELAPPILRGTLGTLAQFCLVSGILVSNLMAFPFANERWRVLFAVNAATSIVQILCFPFLIESPRWLLAKDKKSTLARHIIKQLRGLRYDHEVDVEINHFVSASNIQCCDSEERLLPVMLKDKKIRRLLICALFLQMAQQLSGINAVFYYSSMFFEGLIDNPLVGTAIVGAVNCLATYIALLLMEDSNRRTLILWSAGGMFVSSVALVLCLLGYFTRILSLCFVISFVSFFEIGLGPIPWLIVAEMFEAKYVATAMSASCQLNWTCNFIVGLFFPHLQERLGAYAFVPFATVLLITIAFVICYLPETKGANPEELRNQIVRSLSSMFALSDDGTSGDYTSSIGNIDVEWRRAMDDLQRQEEDEMLRGAYNYGFQPIEHTQSGEEGGVESDWQSRITGGLACSK